MHSSLVRRQLSTLIPPKVATPKSLSGGSGAGLAPLVEFYSKLPKGPATAQSSGIKGRFFDGKNASAKPLVFTILAIFGLGYTIDYNMHLKHHKNHVH
ncbi:ATP17 subunit F of the F0 sector of mitochondrial F1F0 ATP synthase [Pyrrhoderma noxium]|uniref:ATP17 subunit F of the F0 sector of mitochondrial F1F0 ATP synthase n=1 Tax=Pyrrhoderma noxium TaxID=2282107 RepID=A0A286UB55_9AGAM|nr:ATP17 subunit F of the F0 sector of mitochondrial F1F0 ATP synthase [Pyrrhoderma noxium]